MELKYIALLLLVFQNTVNILLMKYSFVAGGEYLKPSLIFAGEVLKTVVSFGLVYYSDCNQNMNSFQHVATNQIFVKDTFKLLIPSGLYVIQNNLLLVAVENLPAAVFQVTYQLKVLTTALFTVTMLYETDSMGRLQRRQLSSQKWVALVLLMFGVAFVQISGSSDASGEHQNENRLLGLGAVLLASISSGYAGIYFEKVLKENPASVWVRNVQLGLWGLVLAFGSTFLTESSRTAISEKGFFVGWNGVVFLLLLTNAGGGLLVGFVVKHADNILKGFATSVAIILSSIVAVFLFNFQITSMFVIGTAIVLVSVYLYSLKDPPALP